METVEILLAREEKLPTMTLGKVYIDTKFFAYSLEDPVRPKGVIVPNDTAIPAGRYEVVWEKSPRLSRKHGYDFFTPRLVGVPGFLGILIHVGNFPRDTEGCVLMGLRKYRDGIGESQKAMDWLYPFIENALKTKKVFITIK
jgi:hypothetical protein